MTIEAPITYEDGLFIGEDYPINFRVYSFERIRLALPAAALATTLTVDPLRSALSSGDKIYFARAGFTVTLSGAATAGQTSLSVTAIAGPLNITDDGRKVKDISAMTLEYVFETLPTPTAAGTTILTKTPDLVNDPADPGGTPSKLAKVTILAADLASQDAGNFFHRLRQTDSGSLGTLARGGVILRRV